MVDRGAVVRNWAKSAISGACADVSSPWKAAREPASRATPGCWRNGCGRMASTSCVTREPGGSPGAEIIRHVHPVGRGKAASALRRRPCCLPPPAAIISTAPSGRRWRAATWVVCDRFIEFHAGLSGRARRRRPRSHPRAGAASSVGDDRPDLTLVLDVPAEEGLERGGPRGAAPDPPTASRPKRWPSIPACARAFLRACREEPERCVSDRYDTAPHARSRTRSGQWCRSGCCQRARPKWRREASVIMTRCRRRRRTRSRIRRQTTRALRPWGSRSGAARCLSQRPHGPRLADRRTAGDRQGDARLPRGPLRAGAS